MINADGILASQTEIEHVVATCYDNEVPPFCAGALERLYGNSYSTVAEWRLTGMIENASTFVLSRNGSPATVFVFRNEMNKVTVLNEVITIKHAEVCRFAEYVFATYSRVTVIAFRAVENDVRRLPFPFQRVNYLEDIVVRLPQLEQDYLGKLGPATRKNLNRHRNRLIRDFPSFSCQIYEREEIDEQQVRALVDFNRNRMAEKNKLSGFDEKEIQKIISLARAGGFMLVARIRGQICGGAICDSVGSHFFMKISSHDSVYNSYRLGTLCCYLSICACIQRGGSEMHLLWGQYEYKYLLLGTQRELDNIIIYRNRMHQLWNSSLALTTAFQGQLRHLKLWLHRNQHHFVGRAALTAIGLLRKVRRQRAST